MKIKEVIGIDVSKSTLDCCIHTSGVHQVFQNTPLAISNLVSWSLDQSGLSKKDILFVLEHTGLYSHALITYLTTNDYLCNVVPGLEIKRSLGITRGKDDKADAKRIARYGYRLREEVTTYQMPSSVLAQLKRLLCLRKRLVSQRAGYKASLAEQQRVLDTEENNVLFQTQQTLKKVLDQQIARIEKEINTLILSDSRLNELYTLVLSVKGVGEVTAQFLIVYTVGFTAFKTWRKFASYCGTAPFPNTSGTSVKGRTKVSSLANKQGKALFQNCATSAIQYDPQLKEYYEKRIQQGKNKMSTLNIIRNKIIARAFAVVKRGTPFVNTMAYTS